MLEIPEGRWPAFQVALHQFVMPVVDLAPDNNKIRMSNLSFLRKVDEIAIGSLDDPSAGWEQPPHPLGTSSQHKNVGKVLRPPLPPASQPAPEHGGQSSRVFDKRPKTTSTSKEMRTKRTAEDEGLLAKRTAEDEGLTEEGPGSDGDNQKKKRKWSGKTAFFKGIKNRCEYTGWGSLDCCFTARFYSNLLHFRRQDCHIPCWSPFVHSLGAQEIVHRRLAPGQSRCQTLADRIPPRRGRYQLWLTDRTTMGESCHTDGIRIPDPQPRDQESILP
jgi:hypothetical protein